MQLTKEATYVFTYDEKVEEIDVFVDNVENRRYIGNTIAIGTDLNYKGTGKPYQKINAELISETTIENEFNEPEVRLMYLLPDVNAYAVGVYYIVTDEEGVGIKNLSIRLLNKMI